MPKNETMRLSVEYRDLDDLLERFADENPKDHDLGELNASMDRFGYTLPPLINETTGKLVAGHGRLKTLAARRAEGADPPERIVVENGNWLVPLLRGVAFDTDKDALAYLLADNRLTEVGGWDWAQFVEVTTPVEADTDFWAGTGFDAGDLIAARGRLAAPLDTSWVQDNPDDEDAAHSETIRDDGYYQMTFALTAEQRTVVRKAISLERERSEDRNTIRAFVNICERYIAETSTERS